MSICGCVKMCYHYSSQFQDQSLPTLSPCHVNLDIMHYQTFQIENTLYLKVLRFLDSAMKKVMNTTHVTVPFVFFSFPTPRSLALSPNMADGPAIITFLCMEKDFCYNNTSKIPRDLSREIMKITVSTVE